MTCPVPDTWPLIVALAIGILFFYGLTMLTNFWYGQCAAELRALKAATKIEEHGIGEVSLPIGEHDPETGGTFTRGVSLYYCTCGRRFFTKPERDWHIDHPQRLDATR